MKSARESVSAALARQRQYMSREGKLDLSNLAIDNLEGLKNQKTLKELYLNNAKITSFQTLPIQPCLKTIIADGSSVNCLSGLSLQPRLSKISLINTPISKIDNFRIAVILEVGRRLSSINGVAITPKEKAQALSYPPIARTLVDCGWIPIYPPPSEADFRYLAKQFSIKADNSDFHFSKEDHDLIPLSPKKQILQKPSTFADRIAGLLRPLGFAIRCGSEMNNDILRAVDLLCETIDTIEKYNDIAEEEESFFEEEETNDQDF